MGEKAGAASIFEFLTAKNPKIDYPAPTSTKLTARSNYLWPKQLKAWTEFTFSTLKSVYGGRLITEARRTSGLTLDYPRISAESDCVVNDEPTTICVLTKWNHTIVNAALEEDTVRRLFHPCIWRAKMGQDDSAYKADKNSTRLKADAGAVSLCKVCRGSQDMSSAPERLPKDYKTASKWNSSPLFGGQLTDEAGEWRWGEVHKQEAMPIRQAYTYCVQRGCRYGCILTTNEAFIFRIKPRTTERGVAFPFLTRVYGFSTKELTQPSLGHRRRAFQQHPGIEADSQDRWVDGIRFHSLGEPQRWQP